MGTKYEFSFGIRQGALIKRAVILDGDKGVSVLVEWRSEMFSGVLSEREVLRIKNSVGIVRALA